MGFEGIFEAGTLAFGQVEVCLKFFVFPQDMDH